MLTQRVALQHETAAHTGEATILQDNRNSGSRHTGGSRDAERNLNLNPKSSPNINTYLSLQSRPCNKIHTRTHPAITQNQPSLNSPAPSLSSHLQFQPGPAFFIKHFILIHLVLVKVGVKRPIMTQCWRGGSKVSRLHSVPSKASKVRHVVLVMPCTVHRPTVQYSTVFCYTQTHSFFSLMHLQVCTSPHTESICM